MTSTLALEYRQKCKALIEDALQRPTMYFLSIIELELLLTGHRLAFWQLGYVKEHENFNHAFAKYLEVNVRPAPSTCSGWARAIAQIAVRRQISDLDVFTELAAKFLESWIRGDELSQE